MRIDAEDLVLRYGDTTALDRLTFSLESGKIYGLLGRIGLVLTWSIIHDVPLRNSKKA
jgi:ABC-type uncharacterized transport system ATPase subunit